MWCHRVMALELKLLSPEKHKVTGSLQKAILVAGRTEVPADNLHRLFVEHLRHQAVTQLGDGIPLKSRFGDVRFDISLPLKPGAALVLEHGDRLPLVWVQGEATVRAMVVVLDRFRVVTESGREMFEFSSTADPAVRALVGWLPPSDQWKFDGLLPSRPYEQLQGELPWTRMRDICNDTAAAPSSSCHGLLKVRLDEGSCPASIRSRGSRTFSSTYRRSDRSPVEGPLKHLRSLIRLRPLPLVESAQRRPGASADDAVERRTSRHFHSTGVGHVGQ